MEVDFIGENISEIKSRDEMIHFLEGYSTERKENLDQRKMRKGLLKSYLLETLDESSNSTYPGLLEIFNVKKIKLDLIDENLYSVYDIDTNSYRGFLETFQKNDFLHTIQQNLVKSLTNG